ncbi:hypothetical protein C8Q78DRAFT_1005256 [Trametes maxima]|nr:hypothetical protein C8Q78DRAFT_1005256 [Trametes maxima]
MVLEFPRQECAVVPWLLVYRSTSSSTWAWSLSYNVHPTTILEYWHAEAHTTVQRGSRVFAELRSSRQGTHRRVSKRIQCNGSRRGYSGLLGETIYEFARWTKYRKRLVKQMTWLWSCVLSAQAQAIQHGSINSW